jgi:hypothetical protein
MGAIAAAGDSQPAFFDPLTLAWAHAYWAEGPAMAALGYADTNFVPTWPDEVGSADLVNTEGNTSRPTFMEFTPGLNNKPALSVTSGARYLSVGGLSYSQPFEMVVVCRPSSLATGGRRLFSGSGSNGIRLLDGSWNIFWGTSITGSAADTNGHLLRLRTNASGTTDHLYVDETLDISSNAGANSLSALGVFQVTSSGTSATFLGEIAFAGVASTPLSTSELNDLHTWAQNHYSTP